MNLIEKVKEIVKLVETLQLSDDSLKDLLLEVIENDEDERLLREDTEIQEGRTVSNKDIREAAEKIAIHNQEVQKRAYEDMDRDRLSGCDSFNHLSAELGSKIFDDFLLKYKPFGPWSGLCGPVESIPEFKFGTATVVVDPSAPNCNYGFKLDGGSYVCSKDECDCLTRESGK
jgi:hypothetical protein